MNTNLKEMPVGMDVQLKVLGFKHNNEVWTIGKKFPNDDIVVTGFGKDDCRILGWKLIEG